MFKKSHGKKVELLQSRRDNALNIFVKTQEDLQSINGEIDQECAQADQEVERLTQLIKEQSEFKNLCAKQKTANDKTIKKIESVIA